MMYAGESGPAVAQKDNTVLSVTGLAKRFGGLTAVGDVTFKIIAGEIFGVIGPNGSGKTTLINLIAGVHTPTSGRICYKEEDITGRSAYQIAKLGIGRTFQHMSLFQQMTVLENVLVSLQLRLKMPMGNFLWRKVDSQRNAVEMAKEILNSLRISSYIHYKAGSVPLGVQRRLSLAIAFARGGDFLLIDEPLSGMTSAEVHEMVEELRSAQETGRTLLIVEHNVRALVDLCDRMMVMSYGKKIAEGRSQDVIRDKAVIESYLGDLRLG